MKHLSFDIICKIADGDISQEEMSLDLNHWKTCPFCQREVEFQRSIMQISRQSKLINPSINFTQNVLDDIIPSQKKKWYEWILHNMGNIIAMTSVLTFLFYIFSVTKTTTNQYKPTEVDSILGVFKVFQDGIHQIGVYVATKFSLHNAYTSQGHILLFAILAIILLVLIDQIAGRFIRQSKA